MRISPLILATPVKEINVKEFSKVINEVAVESKDFAFFLFEKGLRSDVTPKFIYKQTPIKKMFDKSGKLSPVGKELLAHTFKILGLPENTNVGNLLGVIMNAYKKS